MSTNLAYAAPLRRAQGERAQGAPAQLQRPRRIQIVTTRSQRRARPKLVYALSATAVIFAIFLAQLLITIGLSSGAYTISDLQSSQQSLARTASSLDEKLDTLGSSQNLQANALALGMVNSSQAAFLRLSDGAVLGTASAAGQATAAPPMANGSTDSVPNSLLAAIPLIKSTGAGHGDANPTVSTTGNPQSSQGTTPTALAGGSSPASPPPADAGDLPSPVTH
jgi:hypothetical protein